MSETLDKHAINDSEGELLQALCKCLTRHLDWHEHFQKLSMSKSEIDFISCLSILLEDLLLNNQDKLVAICYQLDLPEFAYQDSLKTENPAHSLALHFVQRCKLQLLTRRT